MCQQLLHIIIFFHLEKCGRHTKYSLNLCQQLLKMYIIKNDIKTPQKEILSRMSSAASNQRNLAWVFGNIIRSIIRSHDLITWHGLLIMRTDTGRESEKASRGRLSQHISRPVHHCSLVEVTAYSAPGVGGLTTAQFFVGTTNQYHVTNVNTGPLALRRFSWSRAWAIVPQKCSGAYTSCPSETFLHASHVL